MLDVVVAALVSLVVGIVIGRVAARREDLAGGELQRHLVRCRRREEPATVLVAVFDGTPMRPGVTGALRVTDSSAVDRIGKRWELHAILDGDSVRRDVVERRVKQVTNSAPRFGWATFPVDGLTLEALLQQARARVGSVSATATQPAPDDPRSAP